MEDLSSSNKKGVLLNLDKKHLKALEALTNYAGMPRSVILRELIPPLAVVDAMAEQAKLQGRDERNIARDIIASIINQLVEQMINAPDLKHRIGLQYELLCSGLDPEIKTALLFVRWARARMGTEGYRFEQILYQGKARFAIAIGPGDTEAAIEALKKQIIDYAEKLGIRE